MDELTLDLIDSMVDTVMRVEAIKVVQGYSHSDYLEEQKKDDLIANPRINYKFKRTAMKNYHCEMCGKEIHKNEEYWEYKPNPIYDKVSHKLIYFKWRKRCIDDEPMAHSELTIIKEV